MGETFERERICKLVSYILKERSQKCWEWTERYLYRYITDTIWNIAIMTHLFSREVKLPQYFRSRSKRGRRAIMSSSRCWPSSRNQLTLSDCSNNTNWFVGEEAMSSPNESCLADPRPRAKDQRKGGNWDINRTIRDSGRHAWDDTRVHPCDIDGA